MVPRSVVSETLKSVQLKHLALLCGIPTSGKKEYLVAQLNAVARPVQPNRRPEKPRILSIDLGLKNLAYSLIAPAPPSKTSALSSENSFTSPSDLRQPPSVQLQPPPRVQLLEWTLSDLVDPTQHVAGVQDPFSAYGMAITTNKLLLQLLELRPTHIVVEQQRFRSGGAAAVQEWTLRVNRLESMIHGSLRTLQELGRWDGKVISVPPQRVGAFWLGGADGAKAPAKGKKEKEEETELKAILKSSKTTKKLKITTLGRWIEQGGIIIPGNRKAESTLKTYLHRLARTPGRRRPKVEANAEGKDGDKGKDETTTEEEGVVPKKLDDLTDSLLQGMAWMKWEENRALLGEKGGVEKLLG